MSMKTGGDGELNAEINVTPMVDVMLVLLIIFMITAPMMNTGVQLDLPNVTGQAPEDPEGKLVLSIKVDKVLFLGGTQLKWEELGPKIKANARLQTEHKLYIEADKMLPYGVVVTAMAIVKDNGIANVMLLTNPDDNLKLDELDSAAAQATQNTQH
jgi:biopolymer transport protein TolR|nr:biopolymer transporter ExbD [Kofleriaceae bacterium]